MIWTVLTIILLVVLGGFISYYGDLQGRRWGKKRVSLFGMRPKHTAILLTSITGSLISLFSVITVFAVVPPVREVILQGEHAIRENRGYLVKIQDERTSYEAKVKEAKMESARLSAKNDVTQADLASSIQEIAAVKRKLAPLQKELAVLNVRNIDLQRQIGSKTDQIRRLSTKQTNLIASIKSQKAENRELTARNKVASDTNVALAHSNEENATENIKLNRENYEQTANNRKLIEGNSQLASEKQGLQRANEALQRANETQLEANKTAQTRRGELEAEIRDLQTRLVSLDQRMQNLKSGAQNALSLAAVLRSQRFVTRSGDTLARRIVDSHSRPEAVHDELVNLLEDASATVLIKGGGRGVNGRAVLAIGGTATQLAANEHEMERQTLAEIERRIIGSSTPTLLVATSLTNAGEGEQSLIVISDTPVRPAFNKGEQIAVTSIDASKDVGNIANDVIQFLQKDVRDAALKAGTQPQLDTNTGAHEVGAMTPSELVTLADRIKRIGGRVRITALASTSLTTADPLRITFKTRRDTSRIEENATARD